jgi:gliding motility-associated lipoprotein GldH
MTKYFLTLFSICLIVACSSKYEFAKYESVSEAGWNANDTLTFKIKIEETSTPYNINLGVRYNKGYEFDNIWFKLFGSIIENAKDGKMQEIILFDKIGKPYGDCTGSVCTQIYPIQKNYIFKKAGIYVVKVVHLMRQEPLLGVKDVGIMVEKVKQ